MENSLNSQVAQLKSLVGKLPGKTQVFAHSLINQHAKNGGLSPRQAPYVASLIKQALQADQPKVVGDIGDFAKVKELFSKAATHLKYPKIRLDLEGNPIVVALCGEKSKHHGCLNVTSPGGFGQATWYGRIDAQGGWVPSPKFNGTPFGEGLVSLLIDFGLDPSGVMSKFGKLAGVCGFCGLPLTDARSTAVGYGPTCAEHWGLKAVWDAAAKKVEVA